MRHGQKANMRDDYLSKLQSDTIKWIRFPLIVVLVFFHNQGIPAPQPWISGGPDVVGLNLFNVVRHMFFSGMVMTPFFFISGFLFFFNASTSWSASTYAAKMRRRVRSLLVPYLAWNILCIALMALQAHVEGEPFDPFDPTLLFAYSSDSWVNPFGRTEHLWYPAVIPLWYLRDLFVFCLLAPAIRFAIKRLGPWAVVAVGLLFISDAWEGLPGLSIRGLAFFMLGAYFGINGKNFVEEFRKVEKTAYVAAVVLYATDVAQATLGTDIPFIHGLSLFAIVVAVFNAASRIVESGRVRIPALLTASVFFIFAMHGLPALCVFEKLRDALVPAYLSAATLPLFWLLIPLCKIATSIAAYALLSRFAPRLTKVFTGSR